jgi:hypothetical protein
MSLPGKGTARTLSKREHITGYERAEDTSTIRAESIHVGVIIHHEAEQA